MSMSTNTREMKVHYMDVPEESGLMQEGFNSDSSNEDPNERCEMVGHGPRRRRVMGVVASTSIVVLGAVLIYAGSRVGTISVRHVDQDAPAPQESALFETESTVLKPERDGSMTIAEFVTTRRLGDVAADAFDQKCPLFEPKCNVGKNFMKLMHKQLKNLEHHDEGLAKELHKMRMTPDQQETIVGLLPLVHNPKIMNIGSMIATTVKKWANKGKKTVHHKVKEALVKYSKEHGDEAVPPVNASKPEHDDPSFWEVLMHPKMLQMIGDDKNDHHEKAITARRLDPVVVIQSIWAVDMLLRLVLLVFQVLDKFHKVVMPTWLKTVIMWGNVIGGGITCVVTLMLGCPIVFLQYWLNAWLLYSNNLSDMKKAHIPFWKLMQKLPGLNPNSTTPTPPAHGRLLLADPRFAA